MSRRSTPATLSPIVLEPIVRAALAEDLGLAGDITTAATIEAGTVSTAVMASRERGVVCGLDVAAMAFSLIDPTVTVTCLAGDGDPVEPGSAVLKVCGPARSLLTAERVALNFTCHLSGIATATATLVAAVAGTGAAIACTRKTTPGLRALEKYAVRCGGGINHRFRLDDAVLIKDNHIVAAGGITPAVERARAAAGHLVRIEVECETRPQVEKAVAAKADVIMLDNMTLEEMRAMVRLIDGRAITEASGRITAETARAVAETGVDVISSGAITHSAPILDLGLDFEPA